MRCKMRFLSTFVIIIIHFNKLEIFLIKRILTHRLTQRLQRRLKVQKYSFKCNSNRRRPRYLILPREDSKRFLFPF